MHLRYLPLVVFGLLTIASAVLASTNPQPVRFSVFGAAQEQSFAVVMLIQLVVGSLGGMAAGLAVLTPKAAGDLKSQKKLTEWEAQDAKLAASLQTDKEKQLEAKIATLEAALKQALKKS